GVVALLGPFIGIVVLPLSAAVIPVSVILLAVSVFLPFMVPPIAWATTALTNAIVRLVEWGAALPWAQLTAPRLDGWFIAGIYLLASVAILRWYRHREISMFSPFAFTTARKSR
ncbi:MAG: ComEC/Rec2 family competence protein, partial [bacterium]|nr:ComEC/Rec2 family competence protein [bacterium]